MFKIIALLRAVRAQAVVFAVSLSFLLTRIDVASFWSDETATISASTRSIPQLLVLIKHVDAVHGLYYFAMHFWLQAFGVSKLSLRLPGTIALALAAVILFVLLRKRTNWQSAALATFVFIWLPRVVWASGIGRSYALTVLVAVALTWVMLRIIETPNPKWTWFAAYAVLAAVGCTLFIFLALLVIAHAVAMFAVSPGHKKVFNFALAGVFAGLVSLPTAYLDKREVHQIAWLPPVKRDIVGNLFGGEYFLNIEWLAVPAWLIVAFGVFKVAQLVAAKRADMKPVTDLAIVASISCLLPTLIVFVYSLGQKSIFDTRYFSYSTTMFAVLLGVSFWFMRPKWIPLVLAISLIIVSAPKDLALRQPDAFGNDYDKVATFFQSSAEHGDGVIFAPLVKNSRAAGRSWISYAPYYSEVSVLGFRNEMLTRGSLLESPFSKDETLAQTTGFSRVWLVQSLAGDRAYAATFSNGLETLGFKPTVVKKLEYENITLFVR